MVIFFFFRQQLRERERRRSAITNTYSHTVHWSTIVFMIIQDSFSSTRTLFFFFLASIKARNLFEEVFFLYSQDIFLLLDFVILLLNEHQHIALITIFDRN